MCFSAACKVQLSAGNFHIVHAGKNCGGLRDHAPEEIIIICMAAWARSRKHARAWIALGVLLACCGCAFALDPSLDINQYAHTAWKTGDGFSKGIIYTIAQTPDGYLWLGTEFGLFRFDGVRAVPWQPPAGEHLPSGPIRRLLAARDGTLWIGTSKGLASWNKGKLTHHPELAGRQVDALLEDREGTTWVGTGQVSAPVSLQNCAPFGVAASCAMGRMAVSAKLCTPCMRTRGAICGRSGYGAVAMEARSSKALCHAPAGARIRRIAEDDNGVLLINMTGGVSQLVNGRVEPYPLLAGRKFTRKAAPGSRWRPVDRNARPGLLHVHQGRRMCLARSDGLSGDVVRVSLRTVKATFGSPP